ncbi:MAG: carboxypeptidase-like regulatory domain-containing protein, partial [Candidatus Marinimicrobia bacterium]|nr:carboxypeptidase-like regulatory domain-containing protein [Candidatus Neomarinimicrobiota bacterium]
MKLNKASFQYMFAMLFSVATLFAQNITGTVNGDEGNALAGANVAVEGTDAGASSNQDGSFSISGLNDGTYTVTASYIGYDDASAVVTISGGKASSVNLTLDKGDIRLNQVVVSASLKKELVTEAPASVTVFGGEELEARGATTIADVIGNQAGVEYMKTGLESSNVSLRGFNGVFSGSIHAVVDNRWTRAPVVNAQLLQFFAPDDSDVDRVELVRGPASPMYGPDTQQGVISLFTKSPFNQGNRIAITVGDRNFMKIYGRVAHQWGARAATRVSFSHRSFDDWNSNMPRTLAEANADGHDYFEPELIRRGLQTTAYPFIDYATSGYNDPEGGVANSASSAEPFSPEATVFETKTEFRPDLRSNLTINTRYANLSAIEMTGVGRQFADDVDLYQFQMAYFRQGFLGGDLFLNFFTNINDQKTTYSLVNGNVVYDESSNRAFQLQHTVPMKNGQTIIWGLDY